MRKKGINLSNPKGAPTPAAAFNTFRGDWVFKVPVKGTVTGKKRAFMGEPLGIKLLKEYCPDHAELNVLELGPHEGQHTYHLDKNVKSVYSIEGRRGNFLKCLIVKNELAMNRTHFAVGNFIEYLETTDDHYDLCYASGVLYHVPDPVGFLELISKRASRLVLTTVVYDREIMAASMERTKGDVNATNWLNNIDDNPKIVTKHGTDFRYYARTYPKDSKKTTTGVGASHDDVANLLVAEDLEKALNLLGKKVLHFSVTENKRGPQAAAVVEF